MVHQSSENANCVKKISRFDADLLKLASFFELFTSWRIEPEMSKSILQKRVKNFEQIERKNPKNLYSKNISIIFSYLKLTFHEKILKFNKKITFDSSIEP